jgi:hypothetical protein
MQTFSLIKKVILILHILVFSLLKILVNFKTAQTELRALTERERPYRQVFYTGDPGVRMSCLTLNTV